MTGNTTFMKSKVIADDRARHRKMRMRWRGLLDTAPRLAAVGLLGAGLGACAGGASSSIFVDPATFELHNCQQLGTARRTTHDRVVELEGLMAKAETGAAGSLVSGLAYQTDYRAARARRDQIDEKITSNNCTSADLAPAPTAQAPVAPPAPRRRR